MPNAPKNNAAENVARKIVLGVSGGIAAYKSVSLLRLLTEAGFSVSVVPTAAALKFVGQPTWAAISGQPVTSEVWSDVHQVPHVKLGQNADLVIVAPATADLLAKAAHGFADDLLTNTLLTAQCPVLFAPAMHTEMWNHAATQANLAVLRERGVNFVGPESGRLTGKDTGVGRMSEPVDIFTAALKLLGGTEITGGKGTGTEDAGTASENNHGENTDTANSNHTEAKPQQDLLGCRVAISLGGTREPIDAVRYIANRSSGKQGIALAQAALARGAEVKLVAANVLLPMPVGAQVVQVETAIELADAMDSVADWADVIIMTAAVSDYRVENQSVTKLKKTDGEKLQLTLVQNPDILAQLVKRRNSLQRSGNFRADEQQHNRQLSNRQVIVGFAAETGDAAGDVLTYGAAKLAKKGCDILVVNDVSAGQGFGTDHNTITILAAGDLENVSGAQERVLQTFTGSKLEVSQQILNSVVSFRM